MKSKAKVMMDLGTVLRHLITVQYLDPEAGEDDYGAPIPAWKDLGQLWAHIEPLTGREYYAAAQVQAEVTHRITTRWCRGWHTKPGFFITPAQLVHTDERVGITPQCRLVYGDRVFEVLAVVNIKEQNQWLELRCREKVA